MSSVAHLHRADLVGFRADCPWSTHSFALASGSAAFWCGKLIEKINHTNVFSERRKSHFRGCSQQFHRFSNQFQMFLFFKLFKGISSEWLECVCVCVPYVGTTKRSDFPEVFFQTFFRTMSEKFQLYFRTVSEVFQNSVRGASQRWVGGRGQTVSPCAPSPLPPKKKEKS